MSPQESSRKPREWKRAEREHLDMPLSARRMLTRQRDEK